MHSTLMRLAGAAIIGCFSELAVAEGAGDFLDYCKNIKGQYASGSAAIEAQIYATEKRLEGWYQNPSTIPTSVLEDPYIKAVRAASFKQWEKTATAQELIKNLSAANKSF